MFSERKKTDIPWCIIGEVRIPAEINITNMVACLADYLKNMQIMWTRISYKFYKQCMRNKTSFVQLLTNKDFCAQKKNKKTEQ